MSFQKLGEKMRHLPVKSTLILLFRIEILFLFFFNSCYYIIVPAWSLASNLLLPLEGLFEILLGIALTYIEVVGWKIAGSRIGFLVMSLFFAFWWEVPASGILS
jgi:hypothetical protein